MAYRGRYSPSNPKKYKGDPSNIIYRSLWERKFMVYCDMNERIIEWGSEEFFIPYRSPIDGKIHRYFPDFYVKVRTKENKIKKCKPPRVPKRKTRKYLNEVRTFAINEAKWMNAKEWCKDRNMEFIILTEVELMI